MPEIRFVRPDGKSCQAYLAEPAQPSNGRGIVLIHELWGLAPPILELAERCAREGYRALVPDLFGGKRARDVQEGLQLMAELDFAAAAEEDVRGAAQYLALTRAKVAALGFCMGGALAIIVAARVPEVDAAVCFYGVPAPELSEPAGIHIPLLGHFARRDHWCTPAKVELLEAGLRAAGADYELHHYDAEHAFMNAGGQGYSEPAARLAWQRTLDFLERKLG
jgi:carboxymethylenebutenolidase